MKTNKKHKTSIKHKIAFFLVYLTLFSALIAMTDYYAYDMFNAWVLFIITILLSLYATWYHIKTREKSKVDELAQDIEKVL